MEHGSIRDINLHKKKKKVLHLDKSSTAGNIPGRMISHCVCNFTKHTCHLRFVLKEKKKTKKKEQAFSINLS